MAAIVVFNAFKSDGVYLDLENRILPLTPSDALLCGRFEPFLSMLIESFYQQELFDF